MATPRIAKCLTNSIDLFCLLVYNDTLYNLTQGLSANTSAENVGLINAQINPMMLNQLIAQVQHNSGGLYLPPQMHHPPQHQLQHHAQQQQQPQHQQQQTFSVVADSETDNQQFRKTRSAAIPIVPPPAPPGKSLDQ